MLVFFFFSVERMSTPEVKCQSWPWWFRTACFTHHICQGLLRRSKNSTKHYWCDVLIQRMSRFVLSIKRLQGKSAWTFANANVQDTHQGAPISWRFNPLFLCRRPSSSNPGSGQVEVFFCTGDLIWILLKVLLQLRVVQVGRLGERGHPAIIERAPCVKPIWGLAGSSEIDELSKEKFLSNQSVCDSVNTKQ